MHDGQALVDQTLQLKEVGSGKDRGHAGRLNRDLVLIGRVAGLVTSSKFHLWRCPQTRQNLMLPMCSHGGEGTQGFYAELEP